MHERDWTAPGRIRTSPNLTSPGHMRPNLMRPDLTSLDLTSPGLMRAATLGASLATLRSESETLSEVAHDARNMVTALGLYCEFLEEPGVLAAPFLHYGRELRLVAAASRRLVEKIVALDYQESAKTSAEAAKRLALLASGFAPAGTKPADLVSSGGTLAGFTTPDATLPELAAATGDPEAGAALQAQITTGTQTANGAQRESATFSNPNRRWDLLPTVPVANLAAELAVNHNLLAALAGPTIALTVNAEGCARPVWLSGEDLTRVLVNLVKNSAEAMPSGGRIDIRLREIGLREIGLREQPPEQAPVPATELAPKPAENATDQAAGEAVNSGAPGFLLLTVEDNGPGIRAEQEETIFVSGFTSHGASVGRSQGSPSAWPPNHHGPNFRDHGHRGLGLTISRSIVEGAGGRITAANREQGGARFAMELPLREAN